MKKKCVLFIQGGLGNQLIQNAYLESLRSRTNYSFSVNNFFLSRLWANYSDSTYRGEYSLLKDFYPSLSFSNTSVELLKAFLAKQKNQLLTDRSLDSDLILLLSENNSISEYWMYGYFQRSNAFDITSLNFWKQVLEGIPASIFPPKPLDEIALHMRLGDYLNFKNSKIFARNSIKSQFIKAVKLREELNSFKKIVIFTDSPALIYSYLDSDIAKPYQPIFDLFQGNNSEYEFAELSTYNNIISSNSTFSLCAGMISWVRNISFNINTPTTILPEKWFTDEIENSAILNILNNLDFTKNS